MTRRRLNRRHNKCLLLLFLRSIQKTAEQVGGCGDIALAAQETVSGLSNRRRKFLFEKVQHGLYRQLGCLFGQAGFLHYERDKFVHSFLLFVCYFQIIHCAVATMRPSRMPPTTSSGV